MKHETTINELAQFTGLFSTVDHITVPETNPDTDITEEVTLPPPLIRRTHRRDGTTWWILTPPGIHERIIVADQATITVYLKDVDPHRFTGHLPTPQATTPQQAAAPAAWQPQHTPTPTTPHPLPRPPTLPTEPPPAASPPPQ
ncbi:hypothetical protein, partial [Streptomyces sp. NRRL S-1896]|uniref:hypothetical protein n=1 Tax=Streptomyces sp. NRRL S-1896 TaxID=1463893 RepID=UPI001F325698